MEAQNIQISSTPPFLLTDIVGASHCIWLTFLTAQVLLNAPLLLIWEYLFLLSFYTKAFLDTVILVEHFILPSVLTGLLTPFSSGL